ncbi:MAG: hypothetical protein SVZ03_07455 [Spirochaetota bacterium]|nr:hypothetical protein [Spirochaetota bacterium]
MYRVLYLNSIALFLISNFILAVYAEEKWKLIKEDDGVRIYNKKIKGIKYNQMKAECIMDVPLEVVGEVILDIRSYPDWMPQMTTSVHILKFDHYRFIFYQVIDFPWPLSKRDMVVECDCIMDYEKNKYLYRFWARKDTIVPKKKDHVRIDNLTGFWDYTRMGSNKTLVILNQISDPGGIIPSSIVNWFGYKMPLKMMKNLREHVKKPLYMQMAKERYGDKVY